MKIRAEISEIGTKKKKKKPQKRWMKLRGGTLKKTKLMTHYPDTSREKERELFKVNVF